MCFLLSHWHHIDKRMVSYTVEFGEASQSPRLEETKKWSLSLKAKTTFLTRVWRFFSPYLVESYCLELWIPRTTEISVLKCRMQQELFHSFNSLDHLKRVLDCIVADHQTMHCQLECCPGLYPARPEPAEWLSLPVRLDSSESNFQDIATTRGQDSQLTRSWGTSHILCNSKPISSLI